jgi:hypothetical protein
MIQLKKRYHIPTRVNWSAQPNAQESTRLERVVLEAIRRAIERQDQIASEIVVTDFEAQETVSERFSPTRYQSDRSTYSIPSYDNGGAPTEVPLEETDTAEVGGSSGDALTFEPNVITSTVRLHPSGDVNQDQIIASHSPFEGQTVAIFGWEAVRIHAERYAVSSDLRRAIRWGEYLFGARAFAILEGPFGEPGSRYYVLGTTHALTWTPGEHGKGQFLANVEVWGVNARYWVGTLADEQGKSYILRVLVTSNGNSLFPNARLVEEFLSEQTFFSAERGVIPAELARSLVFAEIDRLISNGDMEEAARRLAELDANAFSLVDWETKARYLQVLIEAWTLEAQEVAIVEIIKSISSRSELFAALSRLQQAGLYEQLFADLDSQIWSLLVVVGQGFGSAEPITLAFLVEILQETGLVPRTLQEVSARIAVSSTGFTISPNGLAEIEEAARGFVRFLGGSLEAIWMLISEPEKVVEGIGQLVKLSVMVQLALLGHPPAIEYVDNILRQMSQKVISGWQGAKILGITGDLIRRIKWAIIWEVASWFIGVGEVKAILSGVGITEQVAAIARFVRILSFVGRATETERLERKLQSLARIVSRSSRILTHEDEVLRMLSHLSEDNVRHLARALEAVDIDETMDLARLQQLLGNASDTLRQAETLSELATKAGGLSDEVIEAFHVLASRSPLTADELTYLVRSLPEGEGSRFVHALRAIPETAFGSSREILQAIATSSKRMDALVNLGYDAFTAIYRRAGNNFQTLDEYLTALGYLERNLPLDVRATEFRQLLDRLERADSRSWLELENARRANPWRAAPPRISADRCRQS